MKRVLWSTQPGKMSLFVAKQLVVGNCITIMHLLIPHYFSSHQLRVLAFFSDLKTEGNREGSMLYASIDDLSRKTEFRRRFEDWKKFRHKYLKFERE